MQLVGVDTSSLLATHRRGVWGWQASAAVSHRSVYQTCPNARAWRVPHGQTLGRCGRRGCGASPAPSVRVCVGRRLLPVWGVPWGVTRCDRCHRRQRWAITMEARARIMASHGADLPPTTDLRVELAATRAAHVARVRVAITSRRWAAASVSRLARRRRAGTSMGHHDGTRGSSSMPSFVA